MVVFQSNNVDMEEAQDIAVPEFLSTHPSPASRIAEFRALMPEAMELYRAAKSARTHGRGGNGS